MNMEKNLRQYPLLILKFVQCLQVSNHENSILSEWCGLSQIIQTYQFTLAKRE